MKYLPAPQYIPTCTNYKRP